jgi:hypothetical protein
MMESEFRQAVHELATQSVDGLSMAERKAIIEDAFRKQDTKSVPPVFALIFHRQWHVWLAIGLAFLGANGAYAALDGKPEWLRALAWWLVCGVLFFVLRAAIKVVVLLPFRHLRSETAERIAAADRGRHSGFAQHESVAGGPSG